MAEFRGCGVRAEGSPLGSPGVDTIAEIAGGDVGGKDEGVVAEDVVDQQCGAGCWTAGWSDGAGGAKVAAEVEATH